MILFAVGANLSISIDEPYGLNKKMEKKETKEKGVAILDSKSGKRRKATSHCST